MTTYNTGNGLGSTDPRDLYDNAQNFDRAMNDSGSNWDDRLGVKKPTWSGLINNIFPLGKTYTEDQATSAIASGEIPNGAFFFVWSSEDINIADKYQNVDGEATKTDDFILSGNGEIARLNGLNNVFSQPNMFYDDGSFDIWASAGTPGVPTLDPIGGVYSRGGTPSSYVVPYAAGDALHIGSASASAAYVQYKIAIDKVGIAAGGKATVLLRAVGKAGPTDSQDRILIQQFDENNSEIPGARITESHPSTPMMRPVEYSHTFDIASNCVFIQIYISVSSSASYIEIDRVLLAAGIVDSYRPSALKFGQDIINSIPEPDFISYLEAQGLENRQPNAFSDDAVDIVSLNSSIVGIGTISASEYNHTPAWKFTAPFMASSAEAGLSIGPFNRNAFGDVVSVSFTLLALEANPDTTANVRMLLRQFNAAGTEITAARKTIASFDGRGFTAPKNVSVSGAAIDSTCTKIDIFVGINNKANASTRSLYFREPLLASGANDIFRRPPSAANLAIKLLKDFSSSGNVVPKSDFRGIGSIIPATQWSAAVDIVDKHGERCAKIVGTVPATLITTEKYDVSKFSSGKMSVSILIMEKIGNQGATSNLNNLRVRLVGYDASGVRINNWGSSPGNDGGGANFYDRNVPLSDITSRTTLAIADNLTLPAGVAFITINFRTEGLAGAASPDMYVTKFSIREGADYAYRSSESSTGTTGGVREVWISQSGSDNNDGSKGSPFATADKALDAIGGTGSIYLAPGIFTGLQFDASKIKNVDIFGSDTVAHNRTTIMFGVPVTGISKTAGYTKVYEATVSIAGQPSFIWLNGVVDAQTLIPDLERHPLDRGRTHRLPWATKIYRAFEQNNRSAALTEIDGDSVPLCYKYTDPDTSVQTLYFSVPGGVDALTASIYVANNNAFGFFKNIPYVWDAQGKCKIHGVDIRYAGFNLRGFRYSKAFNCLSIGAPVNGFDIGWGAVLSLCEAAAAGSGPDATGDGFNAHDIADWYHYDCYGHDCNDDGWSSHENCVEMGYGAVAVFNGGGGLTPAYGAHAKYYNPLTMRNSVNPRAVSSYGGVKFGGVTVVGNPVAGDDGAYTNCEVRNGISRGDKIGYNDDATRRGMRAYLVAYKCLAYDSVDMGYQCQRAVDCGYSGSAPARDSQTIVENTQALV